MDPALLLIMSSFLQLQQFLESAPTSSASSDSAPFLFLILTTVLAHACAIYMEDGEEDEEDRWGGASHRSEIYRSLTTDHMWGLDPTIRDHQWRKHYGLSYPLFTNLVDELIPYVDVESIQIPVDVAVGMVLYRLSQGHNINRLATEYRTEPWVVTRATNMVTKALSTRLYSKYVSIPSGIRLAETMAGFEELTGLPNICGAIDGSPVKLSKKPDEEFVPAHYRCRHHYFAVLLQAVCDHRKLFWDVCVKAPGATDDATHLRESSLYQKLMSGDVFGGSIVTIQEHPIHPYILGDSCYPLLSCLLTPFSGHGLTTTLSQNLFDERIFRGRSVIDEALGLLKGRWQILQSLSIGLKHAPQTIVACCVLHNICQLHSEPDPPLHRDPPENGPPSRPLDSEKASHYYGETIRQALLEDMLGRPTAR